MRSRTLCSTRSSVVERSENCHLHNSKALLDMVQIIGCTLLNISTLFCTRHSIEHEQINTVFMHLSSMADMLETREIQEECCAHATLCVCSVKKCITMLPSPQKPALSHMLITLENRIQAAINDQNNYHMLSSANKIELVTKRIQHIGEWFQLWDKQRTWGKEFERMRACLHLQESRIQQLCSPDNPALILLIEDIKTMFEFKCAQR